MTAERKSTLRSTLLALVAAVAIVGPELASLDTTNWRKVCAGIVGLVVALATNGKGVAIVNLFLPAEKPAQDTTQSKGSEL